MPDTQEIVLRCPDINCDDRANDLLVKEDFVEGIVDDEVIQQNPISDVREPPANVGLDGAHRSLGSMGVHDDSDESYDEKHVILF